MRLIEHEPDPKVGDVYLVRSVEFRRNGRIWCFPVIDHPHRDGKHGRDEPHYHIDWRFMPKHEVRAHHENNSSRIKVENAQYYTPIFLNEVVREIYTLWVYMRDHSFTHSAFDSLKEAMKDTKMVDMICPHHRTNLKSCKPVNGVVTCPQHGLKWCVKTGKQIL